MRNRKWQKSFAKLRRIILLFMLIPVLIFSGLMTMNYYRKLQEESNEKTELECSKLYTEINAWFQEVERVHKEYNTNETVRKFLVTDFNNFQGQEAANDGWAIKNFTRDVGFDNMIISNISVYSPVSEYVFSSRGGNYIEDEIPEWYQRYLDNNRKPLAYANDDEIIIVRNIDGIVWGSTTFLGQMEIALGKKMLTDGLKLDSYTSDVAVTVATVEGTELYKYGEVSGGVEKNYDLYSGMKLNVKLNSEALSAMSGTVITYLFVWLAVGVVFAYLLAAICSTFVYASISDIICKMNSSEDNMRNISNNVISEIKKESDVEAELAEALKRLQSAQLTALQMQINPHFIFNVLNYANAVIFKITKCDNDASGIIGKLSDILRYAMSEPKYSARVSEEIAACKKYIEIEEMKVVEKFDVEWNIDEAVLSRTCPKLFLQPIIENAIMHGIKQKIDGVGKIKISAKCDDDDTVFVVEDNGDGIEKDKLEKLRKQLDTPYTNYEKHIGMRNVNERIRLVYGKNCGVSIDSDSNGTKVTVKIGLRVNQNHK